MPTISSTIKMLDGMSGPIGRVIGGMNRLVAAAEKLNNEMVSGPGKSLVPAKTVSDQQRVINNTQQIVHMTQIINKTYNQTNNILNQTNRTLNQTNNITQQNARSQQRFNQQLQSGRSASNGLLSSIRNVAAAYLSFQGVKSGMGATDNYINSLSRLNLINDGSQSTAQLQQMIFGAANRARGDYSAMANAAGKMGLLAGDAFGSNKELVRFTELMQKSFKVSGASTMEQQAGMYQLTQAMAAGKLQGDEFRSIMENAPMLAQAIADFTGKSKGELKQMSAEGTITADIIKGAMFAAADDINGKFKEMPVTFGDIANRTKNSALRAFDPVMRRISAFLNSPAGSEFADSVDKAMDKAANAVNKLLTAGYNVYKFMKNNWTWIEPVIWGVVAAIVTWTAVQWALNVALTANPIGVIIMAAAALVGIIIVVIRYLINLWNTNDKFAAGLLRAWNSVLNFFDQVPIFFQRVGNGIVDGFQWAKIKSLKLMEDLVNGTIDGINDLINTLNQIPQVYIDPLKHVEFTAKAAAEAEAIRQAGEDKINRMEAKAAEKAAAREQKVLDMLDDRAAKRAREAAEKDAKALEDADPLAKYTSGTAPDINKVGEVGKIRDTVDISSEDLKIMRELAEMKNIQNFVSLTPQFTFGDTHIKQEGLTIDEIVANISDKMNEAIAAGAQGVYG